REERRAQRLADRGQRVGADPRRARMGIDGPAIASVGHLVARKGHDLAIAALEELPGWTLLLVGEGPERGALERQAAARGLSGRVRFLGRLAQEELARVYNVADMLVLASDREGWANVLLESMACGTPVVATRIWGTPEVVSGTARRARPAGDRRRRARARRVAARARRDATPRRGLLLGRDRRRHRGDVPRDDRAPRRDEGGWMSLDPRARAPHGPPR
ncbi:MAG: glycosyltransferase, partial [Alphaproteobacteria bacterium]